jgi:hypothetical protein
MRIRHVLTAAVILVLAAPSAGAALPRFYGTVGPGTTLTLKRGNGTAVKSASAGAKTFIVRDRASNHNFHLTGPGVDRETGIAFTGRRRWSPVQLSNGTFTFLCDRHPTTMRKTFTVG